MNVKDLYFDSLRKISTDVHDFIDIEIKKLEKTIDNKLFQTINELPEKRKDKNILRSFVTFLVYKSLTKENNRNLIAIAALSELNNYNAYLDNWILDNKNNVWGTDNSRDKISYITIASAVYRELVDSITCNLEVSDEKKLKIISVMQSAMIRSYQGQAQDIEMSVKNISHYRTDKEYIVSYVEKSLLQSGHLYGASAEIGAVLADASIENTLLTREIGKTLGTGLHISNDLGDFAILQKNGDFKAYQDQMADLKNGRLTLPIYYVLKYGTEKHKITFMESIGKNLTDIERAEILEILHSSGAYSFCKKLLRKYYSEMKNLIKKLPESQEREIFNYLAVIIRNNKYLANLRK
jgi:geranylgeranyl pyrophosphate synthase